ncbi:glycosyltransferase family 2 protein [Candidatus Auribacterota bacterium]
MQTSKDTIKGYLFIATSLGLTFFTTYLVYGMIVFEKGNLIFPILWVSGFSVLTFNVCLTLTQVIFYLLTVPKILPEVSLSPDQNPTTAVLYPVKDEDFGLYERMKYTISNNKAKNVIFWVLSDSSKTVDYERKVVRELQNDFGKNIIQYRRRKDPIEKKQGNIKDWIEQHGNNYKYMVICDADSVLPQGTVQKFINKAEHPANQEIAIFQGGIRVIHAKTFFSKYLELATDSSQKFNFLVNWRVFERSISIGHGNLIRIKPFSEVHLQKGIICHDMWETAYLDRQGYKTCYCEDIVSYEEVPANYLETRRRDQRWAKGTLQAFKVPFLKRISLATRYYVGYSIYLYLSHILFLFWLVMGFFCTSQLSGEFLSTQRYALLGSSLVDIKLSTIFICTMLIVYLHKLVICKNSKDIRNIIIEIFSSTLISLNNIFYISLDIAFMGFKRFKWNPMSKNPFGGLALKEVIRKCSSGTLFGILCIFLGLKFSPYWLAISLPFVISFITAIPLVYLTSFRVE